MVEQHKLHLLHNAAKNLKAHLIAVLRPSYVEEEVEPTHDDLVAIRDTIEGELDPKTEISAALDAIDADEGDIAGLEFRIERLSKRKARLQKRVVTVRGLILQTMAVCEMYKIELDVGTVSCSPAKATVVVEEESKIPSQFWKPGRPTLDKAGLNRVMFEREKAMKVAAHLTGAQLGKELARIDQEFPSIEGARIQEGGLTLTIRRG